MNKVIRIVKNEKRNNLLLLTSANEGVLFFIQPEEILTTRIRQVEEEIGFSFYTISDKELASYEEVPFP